MAWLCTLSVGIVTALAFCKFCLAAGNVTRGAPPTSAPTTINPTIITNQTEDLCHHRGNNCTAVPSETTTWSEHFSQCPEELEHYCIHGECRYVTQQKAPSCWCKRGYTGSRCEYVDLDWQRGDKRHIIIFCVILGLVLLILLIVSICIYSHRDRLCGRRGRRRRRREEPRNGSEKLSMMDAGAAASTEPSQTQGV